MSNVDEMLRDRLRAMADVPTSSADEFEQDVLGRVARRRRRRRALSAAAVVAVVLLGGAVVFAPASDEADVAVGEPGAGDEPSSAVDGTHANPLVSIAVERGVEGGENIVFTFESSLHSDQPRSIPGVESLGAAPAGIVYTTQGVDEAIQVCESRHFGWQPVPPPTGSVDVFIPAAWMAPGFDPIKVPIDTGMRPEDDPLEPGGTPGKIVGCGPYAGYVQYSIWAPASDDIEHVNAYITGTSRLVVEIRP